MRTSRYKISKSKGLGKMNTLVNAWCYTQTCLKKKETKKERKTETEGRKERKKKKGRKEKRKEEERLPYFAELSATSPFSFLCYRSNMHLCQASLRGRTVSYCPPSWSLKQNWETNKSRYKRESQRPHSGLFFPSSFWFPSALGAAGGGSLCDASCKDIWQIKKAHRQRQLTLIILRVTCTNQLNLK